jgi:hypothetical protein
MFNPALMEKVVSGQQEDRLREAELARLGHSGKNELISSFLQLKPSSSGSSFANSRPIGWVSLFSLFGC